MAGCRIGGRRTRLIRVGAPTPRMPLWKRLKTALVAYSPIAMMGSTAAVLPAPALCHGPSVVPELLLGSGAARCASRRVVVQVENSFLSRRLTVVDETPSTRAMWLFVKPWAWRSWICFTRSGDRCGLLGLPELTCQFTATTPERSPLQPDRSASSHRGLLSSTQ